MADLGGTLSSHFTAYFLTAISSRNTVQMELGLTVGFVGAIKDFEVEDPVVDGCSKPSKLTEPPASRRTRIEPSLVLTKPARAVCSAKLASTRSTTKSGTDTTVSPVSADLN